MSLDVFCMDFKSEKMCETSLSNMTCKKNSCIFFLRMRHGWTVK
jgi:hypothetical protein